MLYHLDSSKNVLMIRFDDEETRTENYRKIANLAAFKTSHLSQDPESDARVLSIDNQNLFNRFWNVMCALRECGAFKAFSAEEMLNGMEPAAIG